MVPNNVFVCLALLILGGVIVSVVPAIWWIKTRHERVTTVLVGAATWFVFAQVLETIPKLILFNPAFAISNTIRGSVVLYTLVGCLLAGVFEETGRFVAFKTILKKRTNKETAISHGIGHGGFEALFLMAAMGIQYIAFAVLINTGKIQTIIDQAASQGASIEEVNAVVDSIKSLTFANVGISLYERVFAILLHVGMSILVFYAVRERKIWMYILSIVIHAVFDVPAALFQTGVITLPVAEIIFTVYALVFFVIVYKVLYKKDFA